VSASIADFLDVKKKVGLSIALGKDQLGKFLSNDLVLVNIGNKIDGLEGVNDAATRKVADALRQSHGALVKNNQALTSSAFALKDKLDALQLKLETDANLKSAISGQFNAGVLGIRSLQVIGSQLSAFRELADKGYAAFDQVGRQNKAVAGLEAQTDQAVKASIGQGFLPQIGEILSSTSTAVTKPLTSLAWGLGLGAGGLAGLYVAITAFVGAKGKEKAKGR